MKLSLILPNLEDAWFWQKLRNQSSTKRYNPSGELSLEKLKVQISESNKPLSAKEKAHRFFVANEQNELVAVIALRAIDWTMGVTEIGYLVDESRQNQGIATASVKLITHKIFLETDLRKIKAVTLQANIPSYRVLEKNSFIREGILKAEYIIDEKPEDAITWALFR